MCLYVDTNKHLANNSFVPKIAETDILVYKLLCLCSNEEFITPYQGYPISFEKGKFVYPKTEIGKINCEFFTIDEGIHSYFSKSAIEHILDIRYSHIDSKNLIVFENENEIVYNKYDSIHYAIIPKGSKYFIGIDGDIVSNNLIVFENEIVYNKYESTHKVTIIE